MGAPFSIGRLCSSLDEMEIGDYIFAYSTGDGFFDRLGANPSEFGELFLPYSKLDAGNWNKGTNTIWWDDSFKGGFYLLKVAKGKLLADRFIKRGSPTALSAFITGASFVVGNPEVENYNGSKPKRLIVRAPSKQEYVEYIYKSNLENTIMPGDTNVWHHFDSQVVASTAMLVHILQNNHNDIQLIHITDKPLYFNGGSGYAGYFTHSYVEQNKSVANFYYMHILHDGSYNGYRYFYPAIRPIVEYVESERAESIFY